MSRSPEGEFPPNPGLPLPIITLDTAKQSFHEADRLGRDGKTFTAQEDPIFGHENPLLREWLIRIAETYATQLDMRAGNTSWISGLVTYRMLRKQAESDAMKPDAEDIDPDFTVVGEPLLPTVHGGDILPFEKINNPVFIQFMTTLIAVKDPVLHDYLIHKPSDPVRTATICGLYWLLKFHSKPREEKKD